MSCAVLNLRLGYGVVTQTLQRHGYCRIIDKKLWARTIYMLSFLDALPKGPVKLGIELG